MNFKIYTYIKYIATFGSIFLFTTSLLIFLQQWKNTFKTDSSLFSVTITLLVFGILIISLYVFIRLFLKKSSPYSYERKENKKLWISLFSYFGACLLTLIYVVVGLTMRFDHSKLIMILFAVFYPLIWGLITIASIYESLSRIGEQIFLYKLNEKKHNKNSIDKMLPKNKRTIQANQLLEKNKLIKIKKEITEIEVEISLKDDYNPFIDKKLNDDLKQNKELNDWLTNKKESDKNAKKR